MPDLFINLPWKDLGLLVAGAALPTFGYIAKRWVERTREGEVLELYLKALELHGRLKSDGVTVDDLEQFQSSIATRRKRTRKIEDDVLSEIAATKPDPSTSQRGMNVLAHASLQVSRAKLDHAVVELSMHLPERGQKLLESSQKAWTAYADAQAAFAADYCEGGSMQPLIHASELNRSTVERIANLRAHLEFLKGL